LASLNHLFRPHTDRLGEGDSPDQHGVGAESLAGFAERLSALERAFARHVEATEAPDSLFAEVVRRAPRFARQIDRLRGDHVAINEALGGVASMTGRAEHADADTIRARVLSLLGGVAHHRSTGAELLYEAYRVGVGANE